MFWRPVCCPSFLDNTPTYSGIFNNGRCAWIYGGHGDDVRNGSDQDADGDLLWLRYLWVRTPNIGNAPNFMVKSIADENGVRMPSFFGYLLWSFGILVPVFALDMLLFFL